MDPRWKYGVFLGRPWGADQNILGTINGGVTRQGYCEGGGGERMEQRKAAT